MTHPSFRTAPRRRGLGAALAWITVASSSCTLASGGTPPEEFDPVVETADATLLFPLPSRVDAGLLRADDVGRHGPLIPPSVIGQPLDNLDALRVNTEADLRLVGLRLDPCSARAGCSPEVRAVFQPLLELDQPTPGVHAADAAVHVFYDVPLDELVALQRDLLVLKTQHGAGADYTQPLGVHPVLAAQGLDGPFAQGLRPLLLDALGADRIARVTVFTHEFPDSDAWTFHLFERGPAGLSAAPIAGHAQATQSVFGSDPLATALGGLDEAAPPMTLASLARLTSSGRAEAPGAALIAGLAEAVAVQDPAQHDSESIDCVSCHAAEGGRAIATDELGLTPVAEFSHPRDLAYQRPARAAANLHAFSYLGREVSVMRRTVHEAVLAAEQLQALLRGR
ncbi:MAG: hypothetical protein KBG28_09230 [Kofleriaceae bacterium]|nr:hypothetical protein [Kofleriaceae bacterium]MBP6837935.1 hypothetical protein [Kofleriaceae bacterium]MBP9204132.1 hypothetical protein [Kofleriaceae bacterium]